MSWLARTIADGLSLDDHDDDDDDEEEEEEEEGGDAAEEDDDNNPEEDAIRSPTPNRLVPPEDRRLDSALEEPDLRLLNSDDDDGSDDHGQGRGVKEDLSELKDSLTRQFWGVASFLAPPPPPPPPPPPLFNQKSDLLHAELDDDGEEENNELLDYEAGGAGQLEDLASFSPPEDYYTRILEEAIGITEEVLAFARNIAHHPETWLDFPIEEEEFDDFDITDAQYKHVLAIEHLAPRLAALRIEFCPVHMSGSYFWMVYFVLLHSRLSKHDADLLSSPQIVQARGMWMQELQKQAKEEAYWSGMCTFNSPREKCMTYPHEDKLSMSDHIGPIESSSLQTATEHEIEKHLVNEIGFVDKSVIREDSLPKLQDKEIVLGSSFVTPVQDDNDDDGWLTDDSDLIGFPGPPVALDEEDISFSDLEDDLDSTLPIKCKTASAEENKTSKT